MIPKLQGLHLKQGNGDWEHQFGISLETLANPG